MSYRRAVLRLRTASATARWLCAALFALLLALRLLSPAGFMPAFEHGNLTIVACPDGVFEPPTAMTMHHHQQSKNHERCPYASASSPSAFAAESIAILGSLVLVSALLLGRAFQFTKRHSRWFRPPLRGPPLTA